MTTFWNTRTVLDRASSIMSGAMRLSVRSMPRCHLIVLLLMHSQFLDALFCKLYPATGVFIAKGLPEPPAFILLSSTCRVMVTPSERGLVCYLQPCSSPEETAHL